MVKKTGFTLIEMVLVMTLLAILVAVGSRVVVAAVDSYLTAKTVTPLADRGRVALERLMAELRGAGCSSLAQPLGSSSLQLTNTQGQVVLFKNSQFKADTLSMTVDGGSEKVLLTGVDLQTVKFSKRNDCLVTIELTMIGSLNGGAILSLPLRSSLYLGVS